MAGSGVGCQKDDQVQILTLARVSFYEQTYASSFCLRVNLKTKQLQDKQQGPKGQDLSKLQRTTKVGLLSCRLGIMFRYIICTIRGRGRCPTQPLHVPWLICTRILRGMPTGTVRQMFIPCLPNTINSSLAKQLFSSNHCDRHSEGLKGFVEHFMNFRQGCCSGAKPPINQDAINMSHADI